MIRSYTNMAWHGPIFSFIFPGETLINQEWRGLTTIPFNFPHLITGFGNDLNAVDKYDDAITAYDEAISFYPEYALAWESKSDALNMLGRITEADAAFAKAKDCVFLFQKMEILTSTKRTNF